MNQFSPSLRRAGTIALLALFLAQACALSLFQNPFPQVTPATALPQPGVPTLTPQPAAQTTFSVTLPEPLQPGETLAIAILDEVTGLLLNAAQYPMSARDTLTYAITLPLSDGSVVKYRYVRRGAAQVTEDSSGGETIRYRMAQIAGSAELRDTLADWSDKTYARPTGSILGQVFHQETGAPLPNLLVTAGGIQSITDSMGRFELPDLPIGTHTLLAYSLDGSFQTFQQGAVVAENNATVVNLRLQPAPLVSVTFIASPPSVSAPGAPIRVAGNLLQLGNTFADLQGGVSAAADRMPVMNLQADGRYATTLSLPVGAHIQYKYTLGDGFWNAEHQQNGNWILREFIVPAQDITLQDSVFTWAAGDSAPILFEASVPSATLPGDIIYIQFNAFGWTEPIPMWSLGNNNWSYKLYSPLDMWGAFHYRYCRNGQCGSADDAQTAGLTSGRKVTPSLTGQDLKDTISAWMWFDSPAPVTLVGTAITPRQGFYAGVETQPTYRPNWSYFAPQAFINAQALGANTLVLTPTWSFTRLTPPRFAIHPGNDPLWSDSAAMISQARALGLNVALFPSANFSVTAEDFWKNAPRDESWWRAWFTRYRAFALHHADLAAQTGAQTLILGGEWVAPALPGAEGAPEDADAQWESILAEVRAHFKGQVWWGLPYGSASLQAPLNFLRDVDGIYLLWSAALSGNPAASKDDLANSAGALLDNEVAALVSLLQKPLVLAVAYPSAVCQLDSAGQCANWMTLSRPNPDLPAVSLSLQTQANLYEAMLNAVNARPWISGFVSRGYYPPAALQDKSASVHGKPAADLLWYWLPRFTGAAR